MFPNSRKTKEAPKTVYRGRKSSVTSVVATQVCDEDSDSDYDDDSETYQDCPSFPIDVDELLQQVNQMDTLDGTTSSTAIEVDVDNLQEGKEIMDNNLSDSTKRQYRAKLKHIKLWLGQHHPTCLEGTANNAGDKEIRYESFTPDIIAEMLCHFARKFDKKTGKYEDGMFQSYQHVSGYRSALKFGLKEKDKVFSFKVENTINKFLHGYERKIANLKQSGKMSVTEGKIPLNFEGYRVLAVTSRNSDKMHYIKANTFLLFCWNLIARSHSVSSITFDHITWKQDAMCIVFPKHKGDQEAKRSYPKHVYANPSNPEICPVLSLALYIWTMGPRANTTNRLVFSGKARDTEENFGKWLDQACESMKEALAALNLEIDEVGTHSFRKGVASFLAGMIAGPSAISIYHRAGWSVGTVQQRYLVEGEGGDQLCGRAASGLCILTTEFAQLPPHFEPGFNITVVEWEAILPGYSSFYPDGFKGTLRFLLASLVYHQEYLRNLGEKFPAHPFFNQRVWKDGILVRLKDKVHAGSTYNPITRLAATGIPPHLIIASELKELREKNEAKWDEAFNKLEILPSNVKEVMMNNFQINGAVPITRADMMKLFDEFRASMTNNNNNNSAALPAASNEVDISPTMFLWGGMWHPFPQDIRLIS
jgi:hypothetical protein